MYAIISKIKQKQATAGKSKEKNVKESNSKQKLAKLSIFMQMNGATKQYNICTPSIDCLENIVFFLLSQDYLWARVFLRIINITIYFDPHYA